MVTSHKVEKSDLIEKLINIRRVAKVVKGGRRFAFSALVVVGDGNGKLGCGTGKAAEVNEAVRKATEKAKKNMKFFNLYNRTIHHPVSVKFGACKLVFKPAPNGSGIISSDPIRSVMEAVGIKDVNIKALGSTNPGNMVLATIKGLSILRPFDHVAIMRGKTTNEINKSPF